MSFLLSSSSLSLRKESVASQRQPSLFALGGSGAGDPGLGEREIMTTVAGRALKSKLRGGMDREDEEAQGGRGGRVCSLQVDTPQVSG